jgi:Fe-S-cluster containining protein
MVEFECTRCGLCCKKIGLMLTLPPATSYLAKAKAEFPYQAKKNGSCEKLDEDNKCTVYDHRPLLCDIGRLGDEPDLPMSKEQWFELNYKGCEILQMELTA